MKLTGSFTELQLRRDLLSLKEFLLASEKGSFIFQRVKNKYPDLERYFVLSYLEYQDSIIVKILINNKSIVLLELNNDIEEKFELISLDRYLFGKSLSDQLLLAVAVDLSKNDSMVNY